MSSIRTFYCFLFLLLSLANAAAGGNQETQESITDTSQILRVGVLPDADSLPLLVARDYGYFEKFQISVELVPFQSPVERDAAFQAGKLDGMIGDVLGAIFFESGGTDITITSISNGRYGIAVSPDSDIHDMQGLSRIPIGVSSNTIIEYLVYTLGIKAGLSESEIKTTAVPKIPIRMELLLQGTLEAAMLPEPLYSLVLSRGAKPVADSTELPSAPGVIFFQAQCVQDNKALLKRFYKAYTAAAQDVNLHPEAYREYLIHQAGSPSDIRDSYTFVTYSNPLLPGKDEILQVGKWMLAKNLIDTLPDYKNLVADQIPLEF